MGRIASEESIRAGILERGLPPKLLEVSDCPIESKDYEEFRIGALECLNDTREFLATRRAALAVDDWPVVAVLLAHEDPLAPYSSETCRKIAEELISEITISAEISDEVLSVIKPRLSKDSWQFYLGERYILKAICRRFPDASEQLSLISNMSSSHLPENQRISAVCLTHLARALPAHDGSDETQANAVLDALIRLTRGRDLEVLKPTFEGIHTLLFSAKRCHGRRSQTYRYVLRSSAMAITVEEKLLYAQVLQNFIVSLKFAAREHTNMVLDVLEFWTSVASTRFAALEVLHTMLTEGAVTDSWRRVAKILLDCAMSCAKSDDAATDRLVGDCRVALQTIRTSEECEAERQIFTRLRPPIPLIPDQKGHGCAKLLP